MEFNEAFLEEKIFKEQKRWVTEYIADNLNWREGYMHRTVYSRLNHSLGILKKIENVKKTVNVESAKEIIHLLYILGYKSKQIMFLLYDWGFECFNINQLDTYVRRNKYLWDKEQLDVMNSIEEAKQQVFQDMHKEVMSAEKKSLEILLKQYQEVSDHIENLSPIKDRSKWNLAINQLTKIEVRLKESHGITDARRALIQANKEIMIHEGKSKIDNKQDNNNTRDLPGNERPELLE